MIGRCCAALLALVALGATDDPRPERIAAAIKAANFDGEILVAQGDRVLIHESVGTAVRSNANEIVVDGGFARDTRERDWPWASVTKQAVAVLVMREVEKGHIVPDAPASHYLSEMAAARGLRSPTVRELLQHRSGLRNPDDSPKDEGGEPSFYTDGPTGFAWCVKGRGKPGGQWRYNNCDYIVLGAMLDRIGLESLAQRWATQIARPAGITARFVAPDDTLRFGWAGGPTAAERGVLARYGAAGGLAGSATDLLAFDRALLRGRLLTARGRAEMWNGDPKLGYMALGQWAFDAPLKGCPRRTRIIEWRGGIGRFQVRNILLPDDDLSVILLTNNGDFDFGEIWQGKGLSHDLLSAVACA